jgi:hypothetical protein
MEIKVAAEQTKAIVDEAFWLAWQACGGTFGMGFLQDRSGVDKAAVIKNVETAGDYCGISHSRPGEMDADYVFGLMMKMHVKFDKAAGIITVRDGKVDLSYQAWGRKYPTYEALMKAAIESVQGEAKPV